jgi:hypothetical protein
MCNKVEVLFVPRGGENADLNLTNPIENGRRTSLVTTVMYIVRKMGHSFFSL